MLSLIFGLVVMGTIGYIVIEQANVLDSLYMTIITMSTVGFKEIHEFSSAGKIFTIILIIMIISIYAYSITINTFFCWRGKLVISC